MNIVVREVFRNEVKVLAFRRRTSKKRAKELLQSSQSLFKEYNAQTDKPSYCFESPTWTTAWERQLAAYKLRKDGAIEARHYNIAYGLMRGIPYKQIERSCKKAPEAEKILEIIHKHCQFSEQKEWTVEKIKELLK